MVDMMGRHTRIRVRLQRRIAQRLLHPREMVGETVAAHSKKALFFYVRRQDTCDHCDVYTSALVDS